MARSVPCDGCVACCEKFDLIVLDPSRGDRTFEYEVEWQAGLGFVLRHKANGDCWYLDRETGCTIHDRRPARCREFDCRTLIRNLSKRQLADAVDREKLNPAVVERGRELMARGGEDA
jgi:hypothetical protein